VLNGIFGTHLAFSYVKTGVKERKNPSQTVLSHIGVKKMEPVRRILVAIDFSEYSKDVSSLPGAAVKYTKAGIG